jgi:adenosylmethionine-8-amino-7-oxononanoate aminotransferase
VADAGPGFAAHFHQAALAEGVFIRPIGHTVYVMPPYVVETDEMTMLSASVQRMLSSPLTA